MRRRKLAWLRPMIGGALVLACQSESGVREESGLEGLGLTAVSPAVVVPGSTIAIEGRSFLDQPLGIGWLRLAGSYAGGALDTELPANFVDFEHLEVLLTPEVMPLLGPPEGQFSGQAAVVVDFTPDGTRFSSPPLAYSLRVTRSLEPELDPIGSGGAIFVNDEIEVSGDGFLLGGQEGTTFAIVEGCFQPMGEDVCEPVGPVEVPVTPVEPFDRTRGTFAFSPHIAGIRPGNFSGDVRLRNDHADGTTLESGTESVGFDLIETQIMAMGDGGSLGQFVDIQGGGFVSPDDGFTTILLEGEYVPDDAVGGAPVTLELVPEYASGRLLRYVINEDDALGQNIDLRRETGAFDGTIRPIVSFEDDEVQGPALPVTLRIQPVKQIVYVKFNDTYVESLRLFGLRALDARIRERILAVLARDYESINIEFREEPAEDFKLFSTLEIAGPDPNGLGLLGYDNTDEKDRNNERLFDYIGGVNALTQENGFPGFGGVFIESLFVYSNHPPPGTPSSSEDIPVEIFDQIFDPVRPDRGAPVVAADFAGEGIPVLTSSNACPATERRLQIACAVWVMGSLIGTTTSHEIGHSLGLADPKGMRFHNLGDAENRLMDSGGNRSFEERAELMGQGPSRYCVESYEYLREILPSDAPETTIERPHC
jgi:hypothetical protein